MINECKWPAIYSDPGMSYHEDVDDYQRRGKAIADGLVGWGNVMSGNEPPKQFENAIAVLAKIANLPSGTLERFYEGCDRWLIEK